MAQVPVSQGPRIALQPAPDATFRAADFGSGGEAVGRAISNFGQTGAETAKTLDDIQGLNARIEANRAATAHDEQIRELTRTVRESLGENAEGAANTAAAELKRITAETISSVSPRARIALQQELGKANNIAVDGFYEHAFQQKVSAFEDSSTARIGSLLESAADEPDENKALAIIAPIKDINSQRRAFFGKDAAWEQQEDRKTVSGFFKSRALKMAVGADGSAAAAVEYATKNRRYLTDDDYNAIVSSYNDNALDELATSIVDGAPQPSGSTTETQPTAAETAQGETPKRSLDFDGFWSSWYVPQEGSTYVVDNNGYGVKYGINAKAHPGEDIQGMTEGRAKQIVKAQYWDALGVDKLPPAIAAVAVDTAVISGVTRAKQMLRDSGGDVDKFMQLRKQFLTSLSASNPQKYPPGTWDRRNRELEQFSQRQGTDGTPLPIGPETNLQGFRDSVMARTDIGLALKRKIIERAEQRRSDAHQEQALQESDAAGQLSQAAAALGDKFTDVKQLPQDAWLKASPETRAQFMNSARSNVENKPLSPKVAEQIGFLRTFKPDSLADPTVLNKLAAQGVPQKVISQLAMEGGQAKAQIAGAKQQPVSRDTLEALAKDPFKSAGFDFWSTETPTKKKQARAAEERDEAQRRTQLLNYLDAESHAWATANPGKQADTKTIQGWIGTALVRTNTQGGGRPFGSLTDDEVIQSYGSNNVSVAQQRLRSAGIPPTAANTANYLRRLFMRNHGLQ